MSRIKEFFKTVWGCITFPFNWLTARKFEKKFTERVEKDKRAMITEKDVEFLKSIGVETDLETLRNGDKK